MKIADLDSRALREPLVAMCEAYGIDPDHAAVCIVTEEVERRRVLLAADVGLIDAVSAAIAGHPSGEWALEATLTAWRDVSDLAVTTRTVRGTWSPGRHVTEMTVAIPSLPLTIKADNGESGSQDARGVFAFAAQCLRERARQPLDREGS